MTSPGPPSASDPSQGRNSLLPKSPPVSAQNESVQHHFTNIPAHIATPGHTMGQSYLTAHTPLKIQAYAIGAGTPLDQSVESWPFAGNNTADTLSSNQATHSPGHPSRGNLTFPPVDVIPVSGKGVIASLTAGCPPCSTRRTPPPLPPRQPFAPSPHEDSVFTYSPPAPDQVEWEQYYYYPNDSQTITPGHDMGDSYFAAHSSPSLGLRRQRHLESADTQQTLPPPRPPSFKGAIEEFHLQPPPRQRHSKIADTQQTLSPPRPPSFKGEMAEFHLQPPPRSAIGPKRESYQPEAPRSAAPSAREVYTQTSPILTLQDQHDRESAAARSHLLPSGSLSARLPPRSSREEAEGVRSDGKRHRVSVDYGQIYGIPPPSPEPNPYMYEYVDPEWEAKKKRRIKYASLSELDDSKLYSQLRNVPSPKKDPYFERIRQRYRLKGHCCNMLNAHTYRDKEGNLITTSSPQISTTRFGLVSVSPIKKLDASSRYYDSQDSSLFANIGASPSESHTSKKDEFERAYVAGKLESSPLRKAKVIDYSKIPPPDFSKIMSKYRRAAPVKPIDRVQVLSGRTFTNFIEGKDLAVVMFHNSTLDQPGTVDSLSQHSLKAPSGVELAFASVDCARETKLCAKEGINSTPFYRMYSGGHLISAVKEFGMMNY